MSLQRISQADAARTKFHDRAIRAFERKNYIPKGWWCDGYHKVYAPNGVVISWSRGRWLLRDVSGLLISAHNTRSCAISKAKKKF